MDQPIAISRGDVVEADLNPTQGSEINKSRRCVIIQNNVGNQYSPLTIIVPATTTEQVKRYPVCVSVRKGDGGFTKNAVILCNQIRAIDKSRILKVYGRLSESVMKEVDQALKISLALS